MVKFDVDSIEARKLLFKHHRNDLRNNHATQLPEVDGIFCFIITAPEFGVNIASRLFTPIAHFPEFFFEEYRSNIPSTEPIVGIFFDYSEAIVACNKTEEMFAVEGSDIKVMIQNVSYPQALEAASNGGANACIQFGGGNQIFLPSIVVGAYDHLEKKKQELRGDYSQSVYELANKLDIEVPQAEIIEIGIRAYRGVVDIDVNVVEAFEGTSPLLVISARERNDVGSAGSVFVESMLEITRADLAKQFCTNGMPFADVLAEYIQSRAIPLGSGQLIR